MEQEKLVSLVLQAQNGDADAISMLFAEYKDNVYSIAMRETKDRTLSDDIVQETFVEVILKINDLKNPASFPAWLKIMAYHQCTRHYKKKETVHETAAIENDEGWSVFDAVEETNAFFIPDEALDQKEFKATILEMIDDLPDAQRAALHMFYFEEMPLKVIAKIQGVSVNTANTRLNRGRLAMKDSIEKYEKKHGVRLHSIAFFPLFKWLFKGSEESMSAKSTARVAQKVSAETGVSIATTQASAAISAATAASGKAAAATGARVVTAGIWTKVVAGVAAASIAISAPFVASQIKEKQSEPSVQNSSINETMPNTQELPQSTLETISEDTKAVMQNAALEYYAPVFEQYQNMLNHFSNIDMETRTFNEPGFPMDFVSDLLYRHFHYTRFDALSFRVFYALEDLNMDGTEELFIGAGNMDNTFEIYSLFSFNGVKPIRLVNEGSLGERSHMTVYEDNTFIIHGSGGAAYSSIRHYRLPQNSFVPEVIEEYQYDNGKCYWKDSTGNYRDITQDKYTSVMNHEGMYVKQLGWKEIILEDVSNSENENIKLQDYLDTSKSWGIRRDVSSSEDYPMEQVFDFAFIEGGMLFCFFYQQYTDFFEAYSGTYSINGNHIIFNLDVYGKEHSVYEYSFDPLTLQLTQVSEKGFWNGSVGTAHYLVNDEWYPTVQDIISAVNNSVHIDTQEMGG